MGWGRHRIGSAPKTLARSFSPFLLGALSLYHFSVHLSSPQKFSKRPSLAKTVPGVIMARWFTDLLRMEKGMEPRGDLLSRLVVAIDRRMRRRLGIWEYSDDPDCILRVGLARSRWEISLPDGTTIRRGEVIGMIHGWNERVPPIPPTGADLAWARELRRRLVRSLQLLARAVQEDPRLQSVRGFGGSGILRYSPAVLRLLERLGIETYDLPPRTVRDWVEEKIGRVWTWLMRRTFNPVSTEGRGVGVLNRRFYWMGREKLLELYGRSGEDLTTHDTAV